jgi:alkylhydroperoxidase family enzyme
MMVESGDPPTLKGDVVFLNEPEVDATVQAGYAANTHDAGYLMNYAHAWAWGQDVADHFLAARKLVAGSTTLSAADVAVVNAAVAGAREDPACSLAWGTNLARLTDAVAAANLLGGLTEGLSDRERALAAWATAVATDPNATTAADVDALRAVGFDDREIAEATMVAAFRLAFTAFNSALGVAPDDELVTSAPDQVRQAVSLARPGVSAGGV